MIEISVWKVLLVLLIALLVLGPEHLPKAAQTLGRLMRQMKGMLGHVQKEMTELNDPNKLKAKEKQEDKN